MTDEKITTTTLDAPPLCMVDYFAGQSRTETTVPVTACVVARHDNVIEVDFAPAPGVPKPKARRLTSKWEEAAILTLLAACAAAGLISLLRP